MAIQTNRSSTMKSASPVLIVQHTPWEHPAAIKRTLDCQGVPTLWLHPYLGEKYPRASEISGLISLGGPMSAGDYATHPWINAEKALIRSCIDRKIPVVGICLGGQLLAAAMGSTVTRAIKPEVGWQSIQLTEAGKDDWILGPVGDDALVYQWHYDTFFLPKAATLLASSHACARQVFRIGENAYGFQFHPEADHQLNDEWLLGSGVVEEIDKKLALYGPKLIQSESEQRKIAYFAEISNLKITTAISQLFSTDRMSETDYSLSSHLEEWRNQRALLSIEVTYQRRKIQLKGSVSTILHLADGAFVIFQEENRLLWPIRADHIHKVLLG